MDVNKLKVFLSVVDGGSINKAADKLQESYDMMKEWSES